MTTPYLIVTPITTAFLALFIIPLAVKIIKLRWKHRVSLYDGGHKDLAQAVRAHGNFLEYVPICLLLLAFSEVNQAPVWSLSILATILLLSRLFHAHGMLKINFKSRKIGMYLTLATLIGGSCLLISTLFTF